MQVVRRETLVREAIDEPVEPIGTSPAEVANRLGDLEPAGCAGRALRAVGGLGGGSFENGASSARGSQLRDQFVSSQRSTVFARASVLAWVVKPWLATTRAESQR